MQTYRIWEGERTFLPGDDTSKYKVTEIIAEEIGWFEDVIDGKTYYVYQTEDEIIVHLTTWSGIVGEPHYGHIFRFRNLEEAAQNDELRQALKDMRLI
jgi:hypothetical protein